MTVYISDTFDRANANGWGTADGGADTNKAWDGGTTNFAISGNKGKVNGTWNSLGNIIGDTQAASRDLIATFGTIDSFRYIVIYPCYIDDTHNYRCYYNGSAFKLYKSTPTNPYDYELQTVAKSGFTTAKMRIQYIISGTSVQLRANIWESSGSEPGTWALDYTETVAARVGTLDPIIGAAKFGIRAGNGDHQIMVDDFSCQSYTAPATVVIAANMNAYRQRH